MELMNGHLSKDPKVRTSDWEARPLTAPQIAYAAADAAASLLCYQVRAFRAPSAFLYSSSAPLVPGMFLWHAMYLYAPPLFLSAQVCLSSISVLTTFSGVLSTFLLLATLLLPGMCVRHACRSTSLLLLCVTPLLPRGSDMPALPTFLSPLLVVTAGRLALPIPSARTLALGRLLNLEALFAACKVPNHVQHSPLGADREREVAVSE